MPLPRLIPSGVLPHSRSVRIAIVSYLAHILCEGWIGSSEAFLGIALLAAIVAWKRGELVVPFHPLYLPLGLFVAASFVSALIAPRPLELMVKAGDWPDLIAFPFSAALVSPRLLQALLSSGEWFPFLTFPLALTLYSNARGVARTAVGAMIALAIFQSALGLTQYFVLDHYTLERRITGTTAHVMTYSGILLSLSLLFLSTSLSRAGTAAQRAAAVLTTLALALTFTRGAWIGWGVGMVTLVALRRARLVPWLLPVALLVLSFSPQPLFSRLVSSFDLRQTSVLDRIRMAEAGAEMIRDHPLFGVGPGNVKEVYPLYRRDDAPRFRIPHLHTNPVQIWAERGLLAFVAWIALIVLFLRESLERRRSHPSTAAWSEGGMAAALGLAVAGLFEFNFGDTEVLLTMLDVWALTLALGGMAEVAAEREAGELADAAPSPA